MKRWSLTSYRHAGLFKEVLQECGIRLPIRTPPGLNVRFLASIRVLVECFDRHLKPFDVSLFSFCYRKSKKLRSKHIVTEAEAMRQACCPGKRLADVRTQIGNHISVVAQSRSQAEKQSQQRTHTHLPRHHHTGHFHTHLHRAQPHPSTPTPTTTPTSTHEQVESDLL